MEQQTLTCPICHEPIEAGQTACPRCGFKLIGETQTFDPVQVPAAAAPVVDEGVKPALEVVKGPYAGEHFSLGIGTYTLGRDPSCDVFLSNMTVSRLHATVTVTPEGAKVVDEGSLNGTWVDGVVVNEAPLQPGTHLQIGTFEMVYSHLAK